MGLNGCLQFIRNKYPHLLTEDHISKYAYQRVIVDIASYIYKYACIYGLDSSRWINAFVNLMVQFKINRVNPIVVFDGKPPAEKSGELNERKEKKQQTLEKIKQLEDALNKYNEKNASQDDIDLLKSYIDKIDVKGQPVKRLLVEESNTFTTVEINALQDYLDKLRNTVVFITPAHFQNMKDILTSLGIPHLQAEEEAEGYCCFLVKQGIGNAVVSCDTDCIAHGAINIIFNLDANTGIISHLNLDELKEEWELNDEQLKDFGLLLGCDYNRKNKIAKIGPVNAIRLLQTYSRIEDIPNITFDIDEINKMRDLFETQGNPDIVIPKIDINIEKLEELTKLHNLNPSFVSQLKNINTPSKIIKKLNDDEIIKN